MSIEDIIQKFSSRDFMPRELDGNPRSRDISSGSLSSRASQHKEQYVNARVTVQDLQKLHPPKIEGFCIMNLIALADPSDYEDLKVAEVLKAFAQGILIQNQIKQGIVPSHYTQQGICKGCSRVWLFESDCKEVLSCPWCFNRWEGLPIPSPAIDSREVSRSDKKDKYDKNDTNNLITGWSQHKIVSLLT